MNWLYSISSAMDITYLKVVLVILWCYNKIQQTRQLKQETFMSHDPEV
jgi:hypothetical protein